MWWLWCVLGVLLLLALVAVNDRMYSKHTIWRNFPVIGRLRHLLEKIGPEIRQYWIARNDEEKPFSRDERGWVIASAKRQNNLSGFGSDNDLERSPNHLIIRQATFPYPEERSGSSLYEIPCAKVLGGWRGRAKAFRPASVINISGMSFGSLSGPAVEALNRGAEIAGCLHNTGEGGISPHHRHGGDLIWQIGTGYFGCRDDKGNFSMERFMETIAGNPKIKAIEIKISQGAKAGKGGILPAAKVTPEISEARGIPVGRDCISPSNHSAFHDVPSLIDFVERLANATGLPVGIKSAVGRMDFWEELAKTMAGTNRGPDFISIDGGEGGTGAAPRVFADHVALPFKLAFTSVYREFARYKLQEKVVFIGAGKLGLIHNALIAFAFGCDMVMVGREALFSIGCIQAQVCHTGHCPTGIATHNKWLVGGLDPTAKGPRCANYLVTFRKELLDTVHACGYPHPALMHGDDFAILDEKFGSVSATKLFGYDPAWRRYSSEEQLAIEQLMTMPASKAVAA